MFSYPIRSHLLTNGWEQYIKTASLERGSVTVQEGKKWQGPSDFTLTKVSFFTAFDLFDFCVFPGRNERLTNQEIL